MGFFSVRALGLVALGLSLLLGCDTDLEPPDPGGTGGTAEVIIEGEIKTLRVDATDYDTWIYLHLETGVVTEGEPWDLAIKRFQIKLNGGLSAEGLGMAVRDAELELETPAQAPDEGWRVDGLPGADVYDDGLAINWWDYSQDDEHLVTPRPGVWFVRSFEGDRYYSFVVRDYYDEAGTAANVLIGWRPAGPPNNPPTEGAGGAGGSGGSEDDCPEPPSWDELLDTWPALGPGEVGVDASGEEWVYVALLPEPRITTSTDTWDLGLKGTAMRTNGGSSGDGVAGVLETPNIAWGANDTAPTVGYERDQHARIPGPSGISDDISLKLTSSWFDYRSDGDCHFFVPYDTRYVLRTAAGEYAQLQFTQYSTGGRYRLRARPLQREVETVSLSVPTPSDGWVWFDLQRGQSVEIADFSVETGWDLGLSAQGARTRGGAYAVATGALEGLPGVDPGQCVTDEASGHQGLSQWATLRTVWALCTGEGDGIRLEIQPETPEAGQITLRYSYTGPGRTEF